MPAVLRELAPWLNVPNVEQSSQYYHQKLGFEILYLGRTEGLPAYAVLRRDGFTVHLVEVPDMDPSQVVSGFVATVDEVDVLFAEFVAAGAFAQSFPRDLDAIREHAPEDKEYGRRDFIFVDPDGHILVFGQDLEQP